MACQEVYSGELSAGADSDGGVDELLACVFTDALGVLLEYLAVADLLGDAVALYDDITLLRRECAVGVKGLCESCVLVGVEALEADVVKLLELCECVIERKELVGVRPCKLLQLVEEVNLYGLVGVAVYEVYRLVIESVLLGGGHVEALVEVADDEVYRYEYQEHKECQNDGECA